MNQTQLQEMREETMNLLAHLDRMIEICDEIQDIDLTDANIRLATL